MWKLTIEQKKPYVYEGITRHSTESISFESENPTSLANLFLTLSNHEPDCETTYKIEKVGEEE